MKAGASVRKGKKDSETRRKCREVLARYGLGKETEELYPFELSGGMTRRVLISTAVMENRDWSLQTSLRRDFIWKRPNGCFLIFGRLQMRGGSSPDHPRSGTGFRGGRSDCCLLCGNQCGGGSGI